MVNKNSVHVQWTTTVFKSYRLTWLVQASLSLTMKPEKDLTTMKEWRARLEHAVCIVTYFIQSICMIAQLNTCSRMHTHAHPSFKPLCKYEVLFVLHAWAGVITGCRILGQVHHDHHGNRTKITAVHKPLQYSMPLCRQTLNEWLPLISDTFFENICLSSSSRLPVLMHGHPDWQVWMTVHQDWHVWLRTNSCAGLCT